MGSCGRCRSRVGPPLTHCIPAVAGHIYSRRCQYRCQTSRWPRRAGLHEQRSPWLHAQPATRTDPRGEQVPQQEVWRDIVSLMTIHRNLFDCHHHHHHNQQQPPLPLRPLAEPQTPSAVLRTSIRTSNLHRAIALPINRHHPPPPNSNHCPWYARPAPGFEPREVDIALPPPPPPKMVST